MIHQAPSVPGWGSYAGGLQGLAAYRTLATARLDLPEAAGVNAAGQSDSAGFGLNRGGRSLLGNKRSQLIERRRRTGTPSRTRTYSLRLWRPLRCQLRHRCIKKATS